MGKFIGLLLKIKFMKMEEWFYLFQVKIKSANWFTVFECLFSLKDGNFSKQFKMC